MYIHTKHPYSAQHKTSSSFFGYLWRPERFGHGENTAYLESHLLIDMVNYWQSIFFRVQILGRLLLLAGRE